MTAPLPSSWNANLGFRLAVLAAVLEISCPLFVALFSVWLCQGDLQLPVVVGGGSIFIGAAIIVLLK